MSDADEPDWPRGVGVRCPPGEVHLWRARLDVSDGELEALRASLSADERERAGAFRVPGPARRFVASRGILRRLLAGYEDSDPAGIDLQYGEEGKPALPGQPLHFNLSHCGDDALLAFARHGPVGVDLEAIRRIDAASIARRFFTRAEQERLQAMDDPERTRTFFRYWTRKEAWAKAHGVGLWQALALDALGLGEEGADGLALTELDMDGLVAAVVAPAGPMRRFRWRPAP